MFRFVWKDDNAHNHSIIKASRNKISKEIDLNDVLSPA